jgi:hypothetical protein
VVLGLEQNEPPKSGGFAFVRARSVFSGNSDSVFNIAVENSVQKPQSSRISSFLPATSTLCTGTEASTFVVG